MNLPSNPVGAMMQIGQKRVVTDLRGLPRPGIKTDRDRTRHQH